MDTANYEFIRLCNKVDEWKLEAEYWEDKYNALEKKYSALLDDSIKHSQAMMGNQLKLCLAITDKQLEKAFKE